MSTPSKKSFETPDERIDLPELTTEAIDMADTTISRNRELHAVAAARS